MAGRSRPTRALLALLALALTALAALPASDAEAAQANEPISFTASDDVVLQTTISGESPIAARPTVVEFSPYGRDSGTLDAGPEFNHLLVQIRGTGDSNGSFDALGPRTQADVVEVLRWACKQPWSDGRLGINGFSASAITIYNSLHQKLPCVKAMVLKSGTFELYRDLLYPGGISNLIPGAGVISLIGAPALAQAPDRDPLTGPEIIKGLIGAGLSDLTHPAQDRWWRQRGFRGNANDLPVLIINGFFDVESRGAFQGFQRLRKDGARMIVVGAHDGAPEGTDGGVGEARGWFDHYLRDVDNGVEKRRRVKLLLADGDREDHLAGRFVKRAGDDWPLPGTHWESLALDPARSGSANSINDGSLGLSEPGRVTRQPYPAVPSLPTGSDPPNTAIVGGFGVNSLAAAFPVITEMALVEPLGLSYTTEPLNADVLSAGPASLDLRLQSTAPETGVWAVISDVAPDGTAHPLTAGRLLSSFPEIDRKRSLTDPESGEIVQPYGRFSHKQPAPIGSERRYRVEFWPIGNRFRAGHRLRLDLVGSSAASLPSIPGVNRVRVGGPQGAKLQMPVLRGSDLAAALP